MNHMTKIIFAISIVLNLILTGVVIGHYSHNFKDKCRTNKHKRHHSKVMKDLKPLFQAKHEETKKLRDEIFTIMTAEVFDPDLYQLKVDEMHQLHHGKMKMVSAKIKEKLSAMSQSERKEFAEAMRKHHQREYGHRR